ARTGGLDDRPHGPAPAHHPFPRLGGSLTDLLHDRARSDDPEAITATRVVLDTSVLISDPECITAFPGDDAVIPLVVVEELDQHKSRLDDVGRAARAVIRSIEELRMSHGGDIRTPVALPG